ncbi:MAG: class I SAM-dependent methyltransferase [Clostridium sp.]
MNEKIGNVILNYDNYLGNDLYSDGEIETEILDIVKNYSEDEFNKIIAKRKKWPLIYHLSHIRSNIVEWIPIEKNQNVLEIGSGCGAITGTLANKAKEVTCIELSKKRSLINAYRNREKDNIEILVGNFQDIEKSIKKKYDYITLIGVFEYGELYINGEHPYESFLKIIDKLLKDNGKLIIAIENKLGLKYWAGCKEDHVGRYFESIEGYSKSRGVKTFSKSELEKIMKDSGFNKYKFYYPYPDYKLPTTIYSDEYLPKIEELTNNMRNFDSERMILFDENKVYNTLIKDGLFPLYSNSYLVIAEKGDNLINDVIYSKYSNERAKKFQIRTDIIEDKGTKYVVKKPCSSEAENHIKNMYDYYLHQSQTYEEAGVSLNKCINKNSVLEFQYIKGQTLENMLDKFLDNEDYSSLIRTIKKYSEIVRKVLIEEDFKYTEEFKNIFGNVNLSKSLKSGKISNIDLVFNNIIVSDRWNVIDYEWIFNFPIPINYIIYRAIRLYIDGSPKRNKLKDMNLFSLMKITNDEVIEYEIMEKNFQQYVSSGLIQLYKLYGQTAEANLDIRKIIKEQNKNNFYNMVQVFYDYGEGFTEENSYKFYPESNDEDEIKTEIIIGADVKKVRIDPCNMKSIININSVMGYNGIYYKLKYNTNGIEINNGSIFYTTEDPQIVIDCIRAGTNRIELKFEVQLLLNDNIMKSLCDFIDGKESEIKKNIYLIEKKKQLIEEKEKNIEYSRKLIEEKDNIIKEKDNIIEEKENIIINKDNEINEKQKYIDNIVTSRGWKVLSAIKKIIKR